MRKLSTLPNAEVTITFKGGGRLKDTTVLFSDFRIKGEKAGGVTIAKRDVSSIRIKGVKLPEEVKPVTATESLKDIPEPKETKPETAEEKVDIPDDPEAGPSLF